MFEADFYFRLDHYMFCATSSTPIPIPSTIDWESLNIEQQLLGPESPTSWRVTDAMELVADFLDNTHKYVLTNLSADHMSASVVKRHCASFTKWGGMLSNPRRSCG
jgi:hypothetical protein